MEHRREQFFTIFNGYEKNVYVRKRFGISERVIYFMKRTGLILNDFYFLYYVCTIINAEIVLGGVEYMYIAGIHY